MVFVAECTPDSPECKHDNVGRVWHGRHGKGAMKQRRQDIRMIAEVMNKLAPTANRRRVRMKLYKEGKLAPHPASRDARVLARSGK